MVIGRMKRRLAGLAVLLATAVPAHASSGWISHPQAVAADEAKAPIALQFRRLVTLAARPSTFPVRISADNRFVLYVNGHRVAAGPARGDIGHWRYETVDLAKFLIVGSNIVGVQVWNEGKAAPLAQFSSGRTGLFIKAVKASQHRLIDGGETWQVRVDGSRTVSAGMSQLKSEVGPTFYAAGGPETLDGGKQRSDWLDGVSKAGDWVPAMAVRATELDKLGLVADTLPQMRYSLVSSGRVVRSQGVDAREFPGHRVTIAPNSDVAVLVDAGRVLAAYPTLITSGGKGARITLTYTEALYDPTERRTDKNGEHLVRFADRARVDDGLARGLTDTLLPDGGQGRRFQPFWWRTWRYLEIRVHTGGAPVTLDGLETYETGYPFAQKARFVSSDPELNAIWNTGWKTALLDAGETYMDTAYWEQLQYIGDTRIQMLLSYDVTGDPRLARQALEAFDHSRVVEGLPQSAWPETNKNVIPPFALLWVGALHDYWMRQTDTSVLARTLPGVRSVLEWYTHNLSDSGIVQERSGWPFVDWSGKLDGWQVRGGTGPQNCVISMMYFGALREAADLENAVGDKAVGSEDLAQAERVRSSLQAQCWDASRGLYADTPAKDQFSQHAAILAVLYDLVPQEQQRTMLEKVMVPGGGIAAPDGFLGSTYYFSFYLARALDHAGLADHYIAMLEPWRQMLRQHLTTFPETPDPSRSDSHAWSAHPTSGLLTYVAGITPAAPGFARIRIAPHLGSLARLDAAMAHPNGLIEALYEQSPTSLHARIRLPAGTNGNFMFAGETRPLREGQNDITIARR